MAGWELFAHGIFNLQRTSHAIILWSSYSLMQEPKVSRIV